MPESTTLQYHPGDYESLSIEVERMGLEDLEDLRSTCQRLIKTCQRKDELARGLAEALDNRPENREARERGASQ